MGVECVNAEAMAGYGMAAKALSQLGHVELQAFACPPNYLFLDPQREVGARVHWKGRKWVILGCCAEQGWDPLNGVW